MSSSIKSKVFAVMLTVATASMMTLTQSIVAPANAHAGVVGSIKSAAKSVGSAVKSTAEKVVSAPKSVAAGTKAAATLVYNKTMSAGYKASSVGGKVAGGVAWALKQPGKAIAHTYPARKIAIATKGIVRNVQR